MCAVNGRLWLPSGRCDGLILPAVSIELHIPCAKAKHIGPCRCWGYFTNKNSENFVQTTSVYVCLSVCDVVCATKLFVGFLWNSVSQIVLLQKCVSEGELGENYLWHYFRGCEWNVRNVYIFLPIYLNSGTGDMNKNLISVGVFCENRRNERLT